MQRISITIDDDLKRELEEVAPKGERAAFVSKAIKKALENHYRQLAFQKILDFKPYKVEQDSVEMLRQLREERTEQIIKASKS